MTGIAYPSLGWGGGNILIGDIPGLYPLRPSKTGLFRGSVPSAVELRRALCSL